MYFCKSLVTLDTKTKHKNKIKTKTKQDIHIDLWWDPTIHFGCHFKRSKSLYYFIRILLEDHGSKRLADKYEKTKALLHFSPCFLIIFRLVLFQVSYHFHHGFGWDFIKWILPVIFKFNANKNAACFFELFALESIYHFPPIIILSEPHFCYALWNSWLKATSSYFDHIRIE